jgi:hypothetical protein
VDRVNDLRDPGTTADLPTAAVAPISRAVWVAASVMAPGLASVLLGGASMFAVALCMIMLTGGLSAGAATGFRAAFGVLAAICVFAAAASAWLRHAERRQGKESIVTSSAKKG